MREHYVYGTAAALAPWLLDEVPGLLRAEATHMIRQCVSHTLAFAAGMGAFMVGAYLWIDRRFM